MKPSQSIDQEVAGLRARLQQRAIGGQAVSSTSPRPYVPLEEAIVFDAVPAMIWFKDTENRILRANKLAADSLGMQVGELVGRSCYDLYPDEAAVYHKDDLEVIVSGVPKLGIIEQLLTRTGEKRWIRTDKIPYRDASGEFAGVVVIAVDLTEQRRTEEALRETEMRFRHFFQNSADAIFVEDLNGNVLDVNPAGCELHGLSREQIVGRNVTELVPPEERENVARDFQKLATGQWRSAKGWSWRGGLEPIPVDIRAVRMTYLEQDALLLQVRDCTERYRAEEEIRETNLRLENALAQLEQTQVQVLQQARLQAIGGMASGIAHDFNNALMPIVGFCDLLLKEGRDFNDVATTRRYLEMIHTAALDAASVVRNLREFSRVRQGDQPFRPVDLNQVVRQSVALTQPRWKDQALAAGVTIRVEMKLAEIPRIHGSEPELREALTNLLFNAVDAMPEGGTIELATARNGKEMTLEVRDSGVGMTERERLHCFEPFFSTKGESGTGLGLAMVYGIVRRHQATIEVESAPGEGTLCRIRFPARLIQNPESPAEVPESVAQTAALSILVVDDESLIREVLSEYLHDEGHRVVTAQDGHFGLEQLSASEFDLVITDRAMPGMSGDQFAQAVKQRRPDLPIILLKGFGEMMRAAGETPPGVDLVVSKPLTLTALRDVIAQVMSKPNGSSTSFTNNPKRSVNDHRTLAHTVPSS